MNLISQIKKEVKNKVSGQIIFEENLSKYSWFNLGGPAKVVFRPKNLNELSIFLKNIKGFDKIKVLGVGSNTLIRDGGFDGIIIKFGKSFAHLSLFDQNTLIAGAAALDKNVSNFALENSLTGFEFLSCIPGTIGGGLKMNSGCFDKEFKDILLSIQAVDKTGKILTIPASRIKFIYRGNDLGRDLIFLSASFKGKFEDKQIVQNTINSLKDIKNQSQPTKIKTGGSTFKNPIDQTKEKVWELIKKSVSLDTKFGDAEISQKHCNFFVNKNNATFKDMKNLIDFVKQSVKSKTEIDIETEIEIVK